MADSGKDFFKMLGVAWDASFDEIKRARRDLAKKFNVDTGSEPDQDRHKEINAAFDELRDPEKRAAHRKRLENEARIERRRQENQREQQARAPQDGSSSIFGDALRGTPKQPKPPPSRPRPRKAEHRQRPRSEPPRPKPSPRPAKAQGQSANYGASRVVNIAIAACAVLGGILLMNAVKAMERHDLVSGHSGGHYFGEAGLGILAFFLMAGGAWVVLRELVGSVSGKPPYGP